MKRFIPDSRLQEQWLDEEPVRNLSAREQILAVRNWNFFSNQGGSVIFRGSIEALAEKLGVAADRVYALWHKGILQGANRGGHYKGLTSTGRCGADRRQIERTIVPAQDGPLWLIPVLAEEEFRFRLCQEAGAKRWKRRRRPADADVKAKRSNSLTLEGENKRHPGETIPARYRPQKPELGRAEDRPLTHEGEKLRVAACHAPRPKPPVSSGNARSTPTLEGERRPATAALPSPLSPPVSPPRTPSPYPPSLHPTQPGGEGSGEISLVRTLRGPKPLASSIAPDLRQVLRSPPQAGAEQGKKTAAATAKETLDRIVAHFRKRWEALYGSRWISGQPDLAALSWCLEQLGEEELVRRIDAYLDDRSDRLRKEKHPARFLADARTLNRYARKAAANRSHVAQGPATPAAIAASVWLSADTKRRLELIDSYLSTIPFPDAARPVLQINPLANVYFRDWLAQSQQGAMQ